MGFSMLNSILSVFVAALIVTVLFRHLKLPLVLGYLFVGALFGPNGLGILPDMEDIKRLAEFGIVFLMFTVGLEFSLPKLIALKKSVFLLGGLQVILCILITLLVGLLLDMTFLSSFIVGGIVAMSSTAIVAKQLNDQLELYSPHGLNAFGILLFQDLAVIPFIILVAGLAKTSEASLSTIFLWAFAKGIIAILLIFAIGRWLLKPLFRMIAKTHAIELFTLTVLLVTLTSAWLTHFFGLSFALGAFLAGMMLAETEFKHQIEVEIRPFRDILLGLFFISIGMLANLSTWGSTWQWIGLLVIALVLGKLLLITFISRLTGNNLSTSLRTGLVLAQGGEFGFAILTLALSTTAIPPAYGQVILAALLISIVLSPLLIYFNKNITEFLLPATVKESETLIEERVQEVAKHLSHHVIICGYGRVGQHIARLLDSIHLPFIGLDLDAELINSASLGGDNVIYGDATHPGILLAAGIHHAKILVVCLSDTKAAMKIFMMAQQLRPELPILLRCRDEAELKQFKEMGATHVIAEIYETSLSLSSQLLHLVHMSKQKIAEIIHNIRKSDYDLLQKVFSGSFESNTEDELEREQLFPVIILEGSAAKGKAISEFKLADLDIEVITLKRGKLKQRNPRSTTKLEANDILVLFGSPSSLEEAERRLMEGV